MEKFLSLPISYYKEGDKLEFNMVGLDDDLMLPLAFAIKREFQNRLALSTQPSFREERAKQQQRYLDYCKKNGLDSRQMFLDF